jgi:hypothetical protein
VLVLLTDLEIEGGMISAPIREMLPLKDAQAATTATIVISMQVTQQRKVCHGAH